MDSKKQFIFNGSIANKNVEIIIDIEDGNFILSRSIDSRVIGNQVIIPVAQIKNLVFEGGIFTNSLILMSESKVLKKFPIPLNNKNNPIIIEEINGYIKSLESPNITQDVPEIKHNISEPTLPVKVSNSSQKKPIPLKLKLVLIAASLFWITVFISVFSGSNKKKDSYNFDNPTITIEKQAPSDPCAFTLIEKLEFKNAKDDFLSACWNGDLSTMDFFIRNKKVDINNSKNEYGFNCLQHTVNSGATNPFCKIKYLLEHKASIDLANDKYGMTPLMLVASLDKSPIQVELIKFLLSYNADPDKKDKGRGWTASEYASDKRNYEVLKLLTEGKIAQLKSSPIADNQENNTPALQESFRVQMITNGYVSDFKYERNGQSIWVTLPPTYYSSKDVAENRASEIARAYLKTTGINAIVTVWKGGLENEVFVKARP
ncbi:MAG: ankyrin repeat domain-containing protein [Leptospiraceae bacterium]|nr:ankyrin repeat domain-containing protein [Leptospiraceae bacterium]